MLPMKPFSEILRAVVPVLPSDWPDPQLSILPGDLSRFLSQGFGLGGPNTFAPWDTLESFTQRGNYYGFDKKEADPIRAAPTTSANGGVIYFGPTVKRPELENALSIIGIAMHETKYALFSATSIAVQSDHYLDQIRIVPDEALRLFGVSPFGIDRLHPASPITVGDLVWRFIELQIERWSRSDLGGTFGGDGDWAKEGLAFGLLVENTYWGVYRLWSRPWLITK
jgi:hypothetical protein